MIMSIGMSRSSTSTAMFITRITSTSIPGPVTEPHSHWHRHEPMRHAHVHYPRFCTTGTPISLDRSLIRSERHERPTNSFLKSSTVLLFIGARSSLERSLASGTGRYAAVMRRGIDEVTLKLATRP